MDELKRIGVFTRVVEAQSFSEAARRMGIAKSAVSKQVSMLEKEVGIRLLNRSPRSLSLTEAGEIYYRHCAEIVNRSVIAINELRQYQNQPTGTLRIASPVSFGGEQLVPIIKEIKSLYPQLKIELLLEDRVINMVDEGVDLSIRIGWMQDSNLVAKKICDSPLVVFASPEYLAKYGTPKTPQDLAKHSWINLSLFRSPLRWTFEKNGNPETVQMHSELKANSVSAVVSLAQHGQGITVIAKFVIEQELQKGNLIELLPDYQLKPIGVFAVYPHRDHVPPKVRILLEFLTKHCRQASWALNNLQ